MEKVDLSWSVSKELGIPKTVPKIVANYESYVAPGASKESYRPLSCANIKEQIQRLCDVKIYSTPHMIFYLKDGHVKEITKTVEFFASLACFGVMVDWKKGPAYMTKDEFFLSLMGAPDYSCVSYAPLYPSDDHALILNQPKGGGATGRFDELLDMFIPYTEVDRVLLKSCFITPIWNTPGGFKPAFVFLGPEGMDKEQGRNSGKTTVVDAIAKLYGGYFDLSFRKSDEDNERAIGANLHLRCARFDNVKNLSTSSELIEKLITSEYVTVKKLYAGTIRIDNSFTVLVTYNDARFSLDLAQRFIPIRLGKLPNANRDPYFKVRMNAFIEEFRGEIYADILHILQQKIEVQKIQTRFPLWETAILHKLTQGLEIDIAGRQEGVNEEGEATEAIEEVIRETILPHVQGQNLDMDNTYYLITQSLMRNILRNADIKINQIKVKPYIMSKSFNNIDKNMFHHKNQQMFLWIPNNHRDDWLLGRRPRVMAHILRICHTSGGVNLMSGTHGIDCPHTPVPMSDTVKKILDGL